MNLSFSAKCRAYCVHAGMRSVCRCGKQPIWKIGATYEGRPQRYGTQWIDDPLDGRIRPWSLAEPDRVNELRATVGLDRYTRFPSPARSYLWQSSEKDWRTNRGGSAG